MSRGLGDVYKRQVVARALLVPAEDDGILKLTDGTREVLVDAGRVIRVEIGPPARPL